MYQIGQQQRDIVFIVRKCKYQLNYSRKLTKILVIILTAMRERLCRCENCDVYSRLLRCLLYVACLPLREQRLSLPVIVVTTICRTTRARGHIRNDLLRPASPFLDLCHIFIIARVLTDMDTDFLSDNETYDSLSLSSCTLHIVQLLLFLLDVRT